MMAEKTKPIDILLVEDHPGDARLAQEALKDSKLKNKLFMVDDGAVYQGRAVHRTVLAHHCETA